ncbi:cytochrome c oxidase assembly protein [Micromonospora deserti]|nr:cytochrome c oxidase assembly protein [Micromonospora deserti]
MLGAGILLAAWVYRSGRSRSRPPADDRRGRCFAGALAVLGIALLSPLETMSSALASAHMVQHLLLVLVAAPLLAFSAPWAAVLRGTPLVVRRSAARWRRRLRLTRGNTRFLRLPGTVWLLHVGTLWFWHAAVPYGAALEHEIVHVLEHASFLITAVLFWTAIIGIRRTGGMSPGVGVLLVFATAMQSVFLSALLTFAQTPWYDGYARTTQPWHLEPLGDQQLAGVIMWIPGGLVYVATGLMLLVTWIQRSEQADLASGPRRRARSSPDASGRFSGGG